MNEIVRQEISDDQMRDYLNDIAKTPLLSAEQEVDLAKRIEAGQTAQRLLQVRAGEENLKDLGSRLDQVNDEELEWLAEDGHKAKNHFLEANLRLVVSVARKYNHGKMPLLDLVQEGNTGLIRAVEKFDYEKGYKFSTYATWWIRQSITRGLAQQGNLVRLPVHIVEKVNKVASTRRELTRLLSREPEIDEIAEELGMKPEFVKDLMEWGQDSASLDAPRGHDDDSFTLMDTLSEEKVSNPQQEIVETDNLRVLSQALELISNQRAAEVVKCRYGLVKGTQMKLKEAAAHLAKLDKAEGGDGRVVSVERARQLEKEGLREVQAYLKRDEEGILFLSEAAISRQQELKVKAATDRAKAVKEAKAEEPDDDELVLVDARNSWHLEKFLDDYQTGLNRRGRILTKCLAEQVRRHLLVNGNAEILEELEHTQVTAFTKYLGGQPVKKIAEEIESSRSDTAEMVRMAAALVCRNMQATARA